MTYPSFLDGILRLRFDDREAAATPATPPEPLRERGAAELAPPLRRMAHRDHWPVRSRGHRAERPARRQRGAR